MQGIGTLDFSSLFLSYSSLNACFDGAVRTKFMVFKLGYCILELFRIPLNDLPTTNETKSPRTFSEVGQRAVWGLIAFATVVGMLWLGWVGAMILAVPAVVIGLHEFRSMARAKGFSVGGRSIYVFGILMLVASLPILPESWRGVPWREIVMWAYLMWVMVVEVIRPSERPLERIMTSLFGVLYIPFLISFGMLLRYTPNDHVGFWYIIITAVGAYASDTGAYFVGGRFGKRKLAPEISPAKTLEGALGGLVFSMLMVFGMSEAIRPIISDVKLSEIWIFAILVSSAAQLGDLAESVIKRGFGVKDSGTFLPGHGGLLDRMDSLLFALPVAYYYLSVAVF